MKPDSFSVLIGACLLALFVLTYVGLEARESQLEQDYAIREWQLGNAAPVCEALGMGYRQECPPCAESGLPVIDFEFNGTEN